MTRRTKTIKATGKRNPPKVEYQPFKPEMDKWFTTGRVTLLFFLLTVIYTFPLIFKLNSSVMGKFQDFYSDIFWYLWCFWSAKVQLLELGKSPIHFDLICGPYSQSSVYAMFKTHVFMIPFTALFNPVTSLNLYLLTCFTLSGVFTWMMIRELTGSSAAGIVPAIAYAFSPYAYARSTVHVGLVPIWLFPLMFFVLFRLYRRFDKKGILLLLLVILCFYLFSEPYYYPIFPLGMGCWLLVIFVNRFIFDIGKFRRIKGAFGKVSRKQWLISGSITIVLLATVIPAYLFYLRPMATIVVRPLIWQERFALTFANYLLPTMDHPILGDLTYDYLHKEWNNRIEISVYLGWTLILLALYGIGRARRDWRIWALLLFGLVGYSITLGPYLKIGQVKIPMPSLLLHELAPFLRSIGRYAICVMLALAALAGFGMTRLLRNFAGSNKNMLAIMAGLTVLIGFEFAHPHALTKVPSSAEDGPPVYAKLAELEEDATVFEYPPASATGMPMGDYFFYQTLHHRELFNRYDNDTEIPDEFLPLWKDLDYPGALTDPANLAGLKYFGVDYIIFHYRGGSTWLHGNLPAINMVKELELVEDFGQEKIYRLNIEPAKALLFFQTREFHNYLGADLNLKNEGFEPPAVPIDQLAFAKGWRLMLEKGQVSVLNLTDQPLSVILRMWGVATVKGGRFRTKINGQDTGEFTLDDVHPEYIRIGKIDLSPHGSALVEMQALDGTKELDSFYRKVEGSAFFSDCELLTVQE